MIKIYGRKNLEIVTGMRWQDLQTCIAYRGFPEALGMERFGPRLVCFWNEEVVKSWLEKNPHEIRRKRYGSSPYAKLINRTAT